MKEKSILSLPPIKALARPTFLPIIGKKTGVTAASRFGGRPAMLSKNEPWPQCGHCKEPLSFLLQLDIATLPARPINMPTEGLVQIFRCDWACDGDWEAFSSTHLCRLISGSDLGKLVLADGSAGAKEFESKEITGWKKIAADFPHPEEHDLGRAMEEVEDDSIYDTLVYIEATGELPQVGKDKLLGWPDFVQGIEYPDCRTCGRQMNFLFQIVSEDNLYIMWGDCGTAMVYVCHEHPHSIALNWACG